MGLQSKTIILVSAILLNACASHKLQIAENKYQKEISNKEVEHTFYLIGDAGNANLGSTTTALQALSEELINVKKNSTLLFLGDNIYEKGLQDDPLYKHRIDIQIDLAKNFKGKTIFIPGNHDWYSGLKALKNQEKRVEKALGKNTFLPENGCPLKKVSISKSIDLILVDTQWYLTNWDKHPTINDKCDIKTRSKFLDEFESLLKKAQGKTTVVALHHPMYTQGPHGGNYDFKSHLNPIPVLGTLKNILRKTTGISAADLQHKKYNELKQRLVTLAQQNEQVVFVSGHEHSLQYIVQDNIPQIVSGSGAKESATKLSDGGLFSLGKQGYAKLLVYKDGSSHVQFIDAYSKKVVFETAVFTPIKHMPLIAYPKHFQDSVKSSVYNQKEVSKGSLYKFFWGKRYRKYYGDSIKAKTVLLDTLFGGLNPIRKGGGHQSKSLRLKDKNGREYVMRALKKSAVQYLQAVAFKNQYVEGQFDKTYTESLLLDVFTGAHPYAPFVVGKLSDAAGVYHTNPELYFVPKQDALGHFNSEFGDELYMIEERAASGHGNKKSLGYSNKLISTDDVLKETLKDESIIIDEKSYIRARLFDMLIGDWDRHEDQWRWAQFKENKKTVYRPVPRDRDQVFSKMSDGFLMRFTTKVVPALRLMQSYDEELKNPKWFNLEPYPLDMAILSNYTQEDWNNEVTHIQKNMTDDVIDIAFNSFPKEVQDTTVESIKKKLKGRRNNLQKIADSYWKTLNKYQIVKGSQKDDWFVVERLPNGKTKVAVYRIKKGKKADLFHQKIYDSKNTKEIWIYGLDDDDIFEVNGKGNSLIKIRIIGGQNKDTYQIENGKRVVMYDYKSKKNIFKTTKGRKKLTDDYEINVYNHKKLKYNSNQFLPIIGSNPDDGLKIGVTNTYIVNGFHQNPFTAKHVLSANMFLATSGFELAYNGEFANAIGKSNLGITAQFTSPNFAINYFGFGNESINPEPDNDNIDRDFNRVKLKQFKTGAYLKWIGFLESKTQIGITYENITVENTTNRFISTSPDINPNVFSAQQFVGSEFSYNYKNKDNDAFPTLGMETNIQLGYKTNLDTSKGFGYLIPSFSIDHKINHSGTLVFATKFGGQINFGNNFEFYQAARLGARNGLRGYRFDRFIGKSAYYQSSDIRLSLKRLKTGLLPINIGLYTGFDYGKVWIDGYNTGNWNTSIGGGFFVNAADMLNANLALFNGEDGLRIAFGLGFGF